MDQEAEDILHALLADQVAFNSQVANMPQMAGAVGIANRMAANMTKLQLMAHASGVDAAASEPQPKDEGAAGQDSAPRPPAAAGFTVAEPKQAA